MSAAARPYFVYLLECRGGRLYAGITNDLERRLAEHAAGKRGAKFTRMYRPVKLLAAQQVANLPAALRLEAALKKLSHAEKLEWAMRHNSVSSSVPAMFV